MDAEFEARLAWIGRRVRDGKPVGVEIVATGLGVSRHMAEMLMAGDWDRYLREPQRVAIPQCPRPGCGRQTFRSHDEFFCMVHGTFATPVRAWDLPSTREEQVAPGTQRRRHSYTPAGPRWTHEERHWWELEERGEPVPEPADA